MFALTHYGFASEHDAYFDDVVAPAARSAATLFAEGVAQAPVPWAEPACEAPLRNAGSRARVDRVRERLEQAYARQMLAGIDASGAVLTREQRAGIAASAGSLGDKLSEFGLVSWASLMSAQRVALRPGRGDAEGRPILGDLLQAAPAVSLHDIDPPGLQREAYCSQGDDRVAALEVLTSLEGLDASPPRDASSINAEAERDWRRSLAEQKSVGFWGALPKAMVDGTICLRNARWLERMVSEGTGQPVFYALGFGHLLPAERMPCLGLLEDLRQRGFDVQRVDAVPH